MLLVAMLVASVLLRSAYDESGGRGSGFSLASGGPAFTASSLGPLPAGREPSGLGYIQNDGQLADESILYYHRGAGGGIGFAPGEVLIDLREPVGDDVRERGALLRVSFPGGEMTVPEGVLPLAARTNFLLGSDLDRWREGVRSFREVIYRDLHPGIDLAYRLTGAGPKYELRVAPRAPLESFEMRYDGIAGMRILSDGSLEIRSAAGAVVDSPPESWYVDSIPVRCGFRIRAPTAVGFACPGRDPSRSLVIDPQITLVYSTFIGGAAASEWVTGVAGDDLGPSYATGSAYSTDFPTTPGAYDRVHNGSTDAFVAKFDGNGGALLFSTFLGGDSIEYASVASLVAGGGVLVTGGTYSSDFPTTPGAYDRVKDGAMDVYVTLLNETGAMVHSTLFGGGGSDDPRGLEVDGFGDVYTFGYTTSTDLPVSPGAFDASYNGGVDAFVAKLRLTPASRLFCTYLGGTGRELSSGNPAGDRLAVDQQGNAFVTGETNSTDFPTTAGAYDRTHNGGDKDVFVAKLNATGGSLLYGTFLGGNDQEDAVGIGVEASGNAYLGGSTLSSNFPTTPGAYDRTYAGSSDGFAARLNSSGSGLVFSTFIGAAQVEEVNGMVLDPANHLLLTGQTRSTGFPTTVGAFDTTHNGGADAFLLRLAPAGDALAYSSFLGGSGDDYSNAVIHDASGVVTIGGATDSADFYTSVGAYDRSYAGNSDAFVAKFRFGGVSPPRVDTISPFDGAVGVALDEIVVVTFDQPMDPASTAGAFSISPPVGGGSTNVSGKVLVFKHTIPFPAATAHTVSISTAAKSVNGTSMASPFSSMFTTGGGGSGNWTNALPSSHPQGRMTHAMAYHRASQKVVMFGGWDESSMFNDTWIYDVSGNTWTDAKPPTSPIARVGHSMAYADANLKIVMFGGTSGWPDTWTYDLTTNVWANASPPVRPTYRWYQAMAYHPTTAKIVMFGGLQSTGGSGETWIYDVGNNTWTNPVPSPSPPPRSAHAMAYDLKSDRIALYGGGGGSSGYLGDVWLYDVANGTWSNATPAASPAPRFYASLDPGGPGGKLVMFGGATAAGPTDETWLYDSSVPSWTNASGSPSPTARAQHATAYDDSLGRVVLFGGTGPVVRPTDTWYYRGTGLPQPLPPKVVSTSPSDGAGGVGLNSTVIVDFDQPMAPVPTTGSFSISPPVAQGNASVTGSRLVWTHGAPLANATVYNVTISTAAMSAAGKNLPAPFSLRFTTGSSPVPPRVVSSSPANGATGVAVDATVIVDFDLDMEVAATASAFSISPAVAGGSPQVAAKRLTWTHSTPLAPGTAYTVTITTAAKSQAGANLPAPHTFAFTTVGPGSAPTVVVTWPGNGQGSVSVASQVVVTFSLDMDPSSATAAFGISPAVPAGSLSVSGKELTFTHSQPFAPGTNYQVTIAGSATATNGVPMGSPYGFGFTTEVGASPQVASTSPADGSTGVPVDAAVVVDFTLPMDQVSTLAAFSISPAVPGSQLAVSTNRLIMLHVQAFEPLRSYQVTIASTARSTSGIPMTSPYRFSFTTEPDTPTYTVSGHVADQSGNPVAAVDVRAFNPGGGTAVAQTKSAQDGGYSLRLPAGTYYLEAAFADGWTWRSAEFTLAGPKTIDIVYARPADPFQGLTAIALPAVIGIGAAAAVLAILLLLRKRRRKPPPPDFFAKGENPPPPA